MSTKISSVIYITALILLINVSPVRVNAQSKEAIGSKASFSHTGNLIQATNPQQEYMGLLELDMLSAVPLPGDTITDVISTVKPSIVRLRTGAYIGSGIIVKIEKDTLIIASNRHQLSAGQRSVVTLFNGKNVTGIRSYVSSDYDLGFLEADISKLSYEERKKLRHVYRDESYSPQRGDGMFLIGSADGVAANYYDGTIADPLYYFPEFSSYMVYGYCRAKPGMSGGGAFDKNGRCIGMITGGIDNYSASLPVDDVFSELDRFYPSIKNK